jgi:hypothetical protein
VDDSPVLCGKTERLQPVKSLVVAHQNSLCPSQALRSSSLPLVSVTG